MLMYNFCLGTRKSLILYTLIMVRVMALLHIYKTCATKMNIKYGRKIHNVIVIPILGIYFM